MLFRLRDKRVNSAQRCVMLSSVHGISASGSAEAQDILLAQEEQGYVRQAVPNHRDV